MNTLKTNFRPTVLSQSLAAILICGSLLAPTAHAARINIPAGSLDQAIELLARQAGIVIAADGKYTRQVSVAAISGELSAGQALQQLLRGSTLEAVQQKDGSYLLRPVAELPAVKVSATAPAAANLAVVAAGVNEAQLPTVRVSAAANSGGSEATATSPVKGYVAKRSATATKTDTPIVETPQSITVIGQNEMRARDAQSVSEALAYVPGVQVFRLADRADDLGNPEVRGFGGNVPSYRDGLMQFASGWIFTNFNEPYAIERIEVLRGPASSIYGAAELGGVIHYQSKRPQVDQVQEVAANIGDRGQLGVRSDLGGQLGDAQWRLVGSLGRIDNQVRYPGYPVAKRDTVLLAPSLSLDLSERTRLTLLGEYLYKEGIGAEGWELTRVDQSHTGLPIGEPSFDGSLQKQWRAGYELNHKLSDTWQLKHNLRVASAEKDSKFAYRGDPDPVGITQTGFALHEERLGKSTSLDLQLSGDISTGRLKHQLLVGIDYLNYRFSEKSSNYEAVPLDINHPVYGKPVQFLDSKASDAGEHLKTVGLYAQDQISIDRWRFTGGLRLDRVEHERSDRLAGTTTTTTDTALTGRIGVNYLFNNGFAPYISYGTSFRPQAGSDRNGKHFDPTEGQQYEAGVRYQPQGGKGMISAAVYQLTKSNVLTADPRNTPAESFQIATGEIRARGLELEARIEPLAGLNLIANYSYNPMKITRSNGSDVGKSPTLKSKHLASAWLDYTVQSGSLRGVGFGLGARYTGPQFKDEQNTKSFAGRTSYDAAISYKYGQWQTRLNATNLTNARPVVNDNWGIQRAPARTVNLDVSYKF